MEPTREPIGDISLPGRRARNRLDKLTRIKEAAHALFASRGYDDATMREIASRAGVGLGTVFTYAATKRDLLFLIGNDGLDGALREARAAMRDDVDLLDNVLAIFARHYQFGAREPMLARLVTCEMAFYDSGAQARRFLEIRECVMSLIAESISLARRRGEVAPAQDDRRAGWVLFCIYQVELRRWLSEGALDVDGGLCALRGALDLCIGGFGRVPRG